METLTPYMGSRVFTRAQQNRPRECDQQPRTRETFCRQLRLLTPFLELPLGARHEDGPRPRPRDHGPATTAPRDHARHLTNLS